MTKTATEVVNSIDWDAVNLHKPELWFLSLSVKDVKPDANGNTLWVSFERRDGSDFSPEIYLGCRDCYIIGACFEANVPWGGPRHTFSRYCRSGKRPHCTCDTCF